MLKHFDYANHSFEICKIDLCVYCSLLAYFDVCILSLKTSEFLTSTWFLVRNTWLDAISILI